MMTTRTSAGLSACTDLENLNAGIAIVGIPHGTLYHPDRPGHAAAAPAAIRRAARRYEGMTDHYDFDLGGTMLDDGGVRVVDWGDLPGTPPDAAGNRRRATETIQSMLHADVLPVVLGGDDSVPIPFFRAYRRYGPLTVIQIDAHLDWRYERNGVTEGPSSTMRRASEMPWINQMIQVGTRGVGSARSEEVAAARAYGAEILTAGEVHAEGVEGVLGRVPEGAACLLTIDCDGLDPSIMPAVDAPLPGGLSFWQVVGLIHGLAAKADIRELDLVEFCPAKDIHGLGALTAVRIVVNAIGALVRMRKAQRI